MSIVIVLGSGNSGSGAIHDYLISRSDTQSPFSNKEFRIVNDPDGLDELYNSLYHNFSLNGSANKIYNFKTFIKNSLSSRYNKDNKIFDKRILEITNRFIDEISIVKYNGCPRFFLDKISSIKKLIFYFKRFLINKNAKDIEMIKMIIPCEENLFLKHSENFINEIFKLKKYYDPKKTIIINQGGNFLNPLSSTKYYGENRKVIFVSRDPKAIYWSMKRRNSLSYPGNNVRTFVVWYRNIIKKINRSELNKIIHIKFENFFSNYNVEVEKLCKTLNLKIEKKDNFDLNYTLKNLYKYKHHLTSEEINYIDKNINEDW